MLESAQGDAIVTRWPEAFSRVVPQGDACVITLGFVACAGHAIVTRWPEAFSRVVPEGDACAITLGFRVGVVLLRFKNGLFKTQGG